MLRIYNTLTQKLEEFTPIKDNEVGIYTCGPTVYHYAHIGNMRTYLLGDFLRRVLRMDGYKVTSVVNVTDVGHMTNDEGQGEDKVEKAARSTGKSAREVSEYYTKAFLRDLKELHVEMPEYIPKATDHINEQIEIALKLEKKGYTYKTSNGLYFDISKLSDYGRLAQLDLEGQKAGVRVEEDFEKKNPRDFALWKFSPTSEKRQMEWSSPWGVGFPGWHIECSAMSVKYLGQPFDFHVGGVDLIFPHHTNEIAQSEAAYGKPLSNFFVHGEFIDIDEEKMSKSVGNVLTIDDLVREGFCALDFRYLVMTANYRTKLNFSFESLKAARNARLNLMERFSFYPTGEVDAEYMARFEDLVNDDLNIPGALAVSWEMVKSDVSDSTKGGTLLSMDQMLGFGLSEQRKIEVPASIEKLKMEREEARNNKDFAKSDALRDKIEELGWVVSDSPIGTRIVRKAR
jgi:cysteinyl-tRNA synthetase